MKSIECRYGILRRRILWFSQRRRRRRHWVEAQSLSVGSRATLWRNWEKETRHGADWEIFKAAAEQGRSVSAQRKRREDMRGAPCYVVCKFQIVCLDGNSIAQTAESETEWGESEGSALCHLLLPNLLEMIPVRGSSRISSSDSKTIVRPKFQKVCVRPREEESDESRCGNHAARGHSETTDALVDALPAAAVRGRVPDVGSSYPRGSRPRF